MKRRRAIPFRFILLPVLAWGGWHYYQNYMPVHYPAYGKAPAAQEDPVQKRLSDGRAFRHGAYTLTPLATFNIKARVLSRKDYLADEESKISPTDLALGWGPMSSTAVLDDIRISQRARFYYWKASTLPLAPPIIEQHSANMHIIPANDSVRGVLKRVRKHHVIRMQGDLVHVTGPNGWRWRSSLTRTDTGKGACELVYARSLVIEEP